MPFERVSRRLNSLSLLLCARSILCQAGIVVAVNPT